MQCPNCKEEMADDATKCPHCGEWIPEIKRTELMVVLWGFGFFIPFLIGLFRALARSRNYLGGWDFNLERIMGDPLYIIMSVISTICLIFLIIYLLKLNKLRKE